MTKSKSFFTVLVLLTQTTLSCGQNGEPTSFSASRLNQVSTQTPLDDNSAPQTLDEAFSVQGLASQSWLDALMDTTATPSDLPNLLYQDLVPNFFREKPMMTEKSCLQEGNQAVVTKVSKGTAEFNQRRATFTRNIQRTRTVSEISKWGKGNHVLSCSSDKKTASVPWSDPVGVTEAHEINQTSHLKIRTTWKNSQKIGNFVGSSQIQGNRNSRWTGYTRNASEGTVSRTKEVKSKFTQTIRSDANPTIYFTTETSTKDDKPLVLEIIRSTNPTVVIKEVGRILHSGTQVIRHRETGNEDGGYIEVEFRNIAVWFDPDNKRYVPLSGRYFVSYRDKWGQEIATSDCFVSDNGAFKCISSDERLTIENFEFPDVFNEEVY